MKYKVKLFLFFISLVILQAGCGGAPPIEVMGDAMMPTLNRGDKVFLDEASKDYARGDIIVFRAPKDTNRLLILRIIGMPGEIVEIKENKTYINGTLLDEPYVKPLHNQFIQSFPEVTVPADRYYVLGDNRDSSSDSRAWGTVGKDLIRGKQTSVSVQGK